MGDAFGTAATEDKSHRLPRVLGSTDINIKQEQQGCQHYYHTAHNISNDMMNINFITPDSAKSCDYFVTL